MKSVYVVVPVSKHLAGQHDQSTHGDWAHFHAHPNNDELDAIRETLRQRLEKIDPAQLSEETGGDGERIKNTFLNTFLEGVANMAWELEHFTTSMSASIIDKDQLDKYFGIPKEKMQATIDIQKLSFDPDPTNWNSEEYSYQDAVDEYVVDATGGTLAMNRGLRRGLKRSENSKLCKLTDWTTSLTQVTKPVFVSRETLLPKDVHEQLTVGSVYTDKGFQSTQLGFSGSGYGKIRQDEGAVGDLVRSIIELPVGQNVGMFQWGEVVLPRNTSIEVVKREVADDGTITLWSRVVK